MADIKNINFGGIVPDKRMAFYNGQPVEIKRTYRIVKGVPEIIWEVGDIPPVPAVNEFIISMQATELNGRYYVSIPNMELDTNSHKGIIEWDDGQSEIYISSNDYVHWYDDDGIKTVKIYAPIELLYNKSVTGVFYRNIIEYIKFPESLKSLNGYAFNSCYRIAEIDFNEVEEIQTGAFHQSMMYFPYVPYNSYVDLDFKNIKIIKKEIFAGGAASEAPGGTAVKSIHIYDKIEIIENNAFRGCRNLTITIDKSKDSIPGSPWGAVNAQIIWRG